jgi:hypothetical protein
MKCKSSEPLMYIDSEGLLHINQSIKLSKGYTSLRCDCQPILRINGAEVKFGDEIQCTEPVYILCCGLYPVRSAAKFGQVLSPTFV